MKRVAVLIALSLVTALAATGCSGDDGPSIVVYNAQHEQLLEEIAPAFTEEDRDQGRAAQRQRPRAGRPADAGGRRLAGRRLPHRELPGDVGRSSARACSPRSDAAAARPDPRAVPARERPVDRLRRPLDGAGLQHRAWSSEAELPDSIMDLADPEWKGRVSFSPTGADFQAIVAAVLDLEGEEATRAWLAGLKANGTTYDGNNVVLEAVNAGRVATSGSSTTTTGTATRPSPVTTATTSKLYFFGNQDPGAFLSVSGAGVLKSSEHAGRGAEVRRLPHQRGGPEDARRQLRAGVPAQPGRRRSGRRSSRSTSCSPPTVDVSDLDGTRWSKLHDRGRVPLSVTPAPIPPGPSAVGVAAAPARRDAVAAPRLTLIPLGCVVVERPRSSVSATRWTSWPARASASCCGTPCGCWSATVALSAVLGVGCAWLVERSGVRAEGPVARLLAAPLAVPAFVNGYGWVSTTHAVQSYPGAVMVVTPLLLPAGLPADRRHPAPRRPRLWRRWPPRSADRPWRRLLPGRAPHDQPGGARRVPAGRAARAGGVRRPAAAQLPDPDHLDPRPVPVHLQRAGGRAAGGACWPRSAWCWPCSSCAPRVVVAAPGWVPALRAPARPRRARRGRPGLVARAPGAGAAGAGGPARQPGPLDGARHVDRVPRRRPRGGDPVHGRAGARRRCRGGGGRRSRSPGSRCATVAALAMLVERSTYIANALPGIVVALALVTVSIRLVPALYQTLPVLVRRLRDPVPAPCGGLASGRTLELAPPVLEDVARSLGCGSLATARRVTLPLVLPGVAAGVALVAPRGRDRADRDAAARADRA